MKLLAIVQQKYIKYVIHSLTSKEITTFGNKMTEKTGLFFDILI